MKFLVQFKVDQSICLVKHTMLFLHSASKSNRKKDSLTMGLRTIAGRKKNLKFSAYDRLSRYKNLY